jgi:type VI secretion system protein ImpK
MSEQDPVPANDAEDDRTVFRPRPAGNDETILAGVFENRPGDDKTVVLAGARLRRQGSAVLSKPAEVAGDPVPRTAAVQTSELDAANANPLVRAAAPLLLLLGRLRTSLIRARAAAAAPQIAAGIEGCERELLAAEAAPEDVRAVKYILCVTADEVLANLPSTDLDEAPRVSLLARFFGESNGGGTFLDELDRAREDPRRHYFLLELFQACLTLCFQGGHSSVLGGPATLQDLRQDLHERLCEVRPVRSEPLSPRWEGQPLPGQAAQVRVPLWSAASFAGLALVVIFVGMRVTLGGRAEAVATQLRGVAPPAQVQIREAHVPPPLQPPPTAAQVAQIAHVRKVLEPGIASGTLDVQATPNRIVVRIAESALFQPGKASLLEEARPLVMLVAYALDDEAGAVEVLGHADPSSVAGTRFASSFELSRERAKAVATLLARSLSDPARVSAEGRGADDPITAGDSPETRSKNARVDVVIPRSY